MKTIGIKASEREYETIKELSEKNGQTMSTFCREALHVSLDRESMGKLLQEVIEWTQSYQQGLAAISDNTSEKMTAILQQVNDIAQATTSTLKHSSDEFRSILAPASKAMNEVSKGTRRMSMKWIAVTALAVSLSGLGINTYWVHLRSHTQELKQARDYWLGTTVSLNDYLVHLYPHLNSTRQKEINELYLKAGIPLPGMQIEEGK